MPFRNQKIVQHMVHRFFSRVAKNLFCGTVPKNDFALATQQYQRILELVSSAQNSRATVVKTADILAVPFTVISLVIACVAWGVSGVPTRFAQVLVLATPCPLLIAAPVAYMAGTGRLAKAGILIKAQEILENLGRVSHIFFDKTGTLTVKQPQVVRVDLLPDAGAGIPMRVTEDEERDGLDLTSHGERAWEMD